MATPRLAGRIGIAVECGDTTMPKKGKEQLERLVPQEGAEHATGAKGKATTQTQKTTLGRAK
jgi:hypothetical protein